MNCVVIKYLKLRYHYILYSLRILCNYSRDFNLVPSSLYNNTQISITYFTLIELVKKI